MELTQQEFSSLLVCPRQWFYRHLRGVDQDSAHWRGLVGGAVTISLDQYYRRMSDGRPMEPHELKRSGLAAVRLLAHSAPSINDPNQNLEAHVVGLLEQFFSNPYRPQKILCVGQRHRVNLGDLFAIAVADLITEESDGTISVLTHKTTGRRDPTLSDGIGPVDYIRVYAASALTGRPPAEIAVKYQCLITTKAPKVEVVVVDRGKGLNETENFDTWLGIARMRAILKDTNDDKKTLCVRRRGFWCGYCGHTKACERR